MDPTQLKLFPDDVSRFPLVVGITSPAPRSGKTTMADVLVEEYGYTRLKFAKYLKQMVAMIVKAFGYTEARAEFLIETRKDEVFEDLGCTLRHVMESLGTDWGRGLIRPDLWIILWKAEADRLVREGKRVVADDMRFMNEVQALKAIPGSQTLMVIRPLALVPPRHGATVEGLIAPEACDHQVVNDSDISTLEWWVRNWIEGR